MTGQRATLDDSTIFGIERALLNISFIYLFISIEENAVSFMNLNYIELVCKTLHEKLSKMVVKSAATFNLTHSTKIIRK